jgi:peptide-methionine (S)-S-oxide reductase
MVFATFGAGCFWGVESAFSKLNVKTTVGYMGGSKTTAKYLIVCSKITKHVEVVQIEYDQKKISYKKLLKFFWDCHDPTQHNKQGPNIGFQYKSIIFYHNEKQKKEALESKKQKQKMSNSKIETVIEPAKKFYKAEEYHQKYNEKNGRTCHY